MLSIHPIPAAYPAVRRGIRCCVKEQCAFAVIACVVQSGVDVVNEIAIITIVGGLHGDKIAVVIIGVLEGLFEVAHRSIFALLFGHITIDIVRIRAMTNCCRKFKTM